MMCDMPFYLDVATILSDVSKTMTEFLLSSIDFLLAYVKALSLLLRSKIREVAVLQCLSFPCLDIVHCVR